MADTLDALVLVPDFFNGEPLPLSLFPPDTDEKRQMTRAFIAGKAEPGKNVEALLAVTKEAKGKWNSVTGWGALLGW